MMLCKKNYGIIKCVDAYDYFEKLWIFLELMDIGAITECLQDMRGNLKENHELSSPTMKRPGKTSGIAAPKKWRCVSRQGVQCRDSPNPSDRNARVLLCGDIIEAKREGGWLKLKETVQQRG